MKYHAMALVLGSAMLVNWQAGNATVIDTTSLWDGGAFSIGADETYAQTFSVGGPDFLLTSVSFQALDIRFPGDPGYGVPYTFQLSIKEWNNGPIGAVLYSEAQANSSYLDWNTLTFNTGAVNLLAGQLYAMILSASANPEDPTYSTDVSYTASNVYSDGGFYAFYGNQWNETGGDLAFKATLTSVPVPSAIWLLVSGLLSLAVASGRVAKSKFVA